MTMKIITVRRILDQYMAELGITDKEFIKSVLKEDVFLTNFNTDELMDYVDHLVKEQGIKINQAIS